MCGALLQMIERDAGGEHVVVEADEMREFRVQDDAFSTLLPLNPKILALSEKGLSRLPFLRPLGGEYLEIDAGAIRN